MSRHEYRQQQREKKAAFEKRDRERVKAEQRYAKEHPEMAELEGQIDNQVVEQKVSRLRRRLNWVIFWLSVGIVGVILILFFVKF